MQLDFELIKRLRAEKGWTQQQLADIGGISLRTVQRVELHGIASLETTKALASAFDTSHSALEQSFDTADLHASESISSKLQASWWMLLIAFIAGAVSAFLFLKIVIG